MRSEEEDGGGAEEGEEEAVRVSDAQRVVCGIVADALLAVSLLPL